MKRVRCPKCEQYITFDETQYTPGQSLVFKCPDCGKEIPLFGASNAQKTAQEFGISPVVRLPLNPAVARAVDEGQIEAVREEALEPLVSQLTALNK